MKIIHGSSEAKATILKRSLLEQSKLPPALKEGIKKVFGQELTAEQAVQQILADVRRRGDAALFDYSLRIDNVKLTALEVGKDKVKAARSQVDPKLIAALELAAEKVAAFHEKQKKHSSRSFYQNGLGQTVRAMERVGVYIPGGRAPYPSTVLMTAIPARIAGVSEIILTTPPTPTGDVPASILAAAGIARVDRVFSVGGAQAIGALAYGTESVPRVDKICGPGNIFVALAKKFVFGAVAIDGIQGPTETMVVADETANPTLCALDLLAQAEHDPLATAILITTSLQLAEEINLEIDKQMATLERSQIIAQSLEARGGMIVVPTISEAIDLVNFYAPEHVAILTKDALSWKDSMRNAGGVFLGESSPETLGDYTAGPSHVMPTNGTARFSSALGVPDFLKITNVVAVSRRKLGEIGPAASTIARAEGLTAHALTIEERLKKK